MKKWYKKYVNYIVGVLLGMLCVKSCNMNRTERWYNSKLIEKELIIDSLTRTISDMNDSIYIYNINNDIAMDKINELTNQINDLKATNKYFQRTQSTLIITNKTLLEQK